jgi:hypothetical protein
MTSPVFPSSTPNIQQLVMRPLPEAVRGVYIVSTSSEGLPLDQSDPLVFDATIESNFSRQAEITNNPIETNDGDVTDHRRTKPTTWRFRAVLTNEDPDPLVAQQRAMAASDDHDPLASARANGPQVNKARAGELLHRLRVIFERSECVTVYTDLDVLENAVLESLEYKTLAVEFDSVSGGNLPSAIEVSGTFRQLRFATTKTVELPAEEVKRSTGKKVRRGTVQGKPASDEIKQKSKSALKAFAPTRVGGFQILPE